MLSEVDVLKLVCYRLEQADIPYMLTGSVAANFYAVPRMTRDIDIVIEVNKSSVSKIMQAFQNEFYIDEDSINEAIQRQGMFNIIHNDSVFKIDFIVRKETSYRTTEFQRRQQVHLDNITIWLVAPEDLIISKLIWAKDSSSELQLKDIRNLFQTVKNLDRSYIESWVTKLGLFPIYHKALLNE